MHFGKGSLSERYLLSTLLAQLQSIEVARPIELNRREDRGRRTWSRYPLADVYRVTLRPLSWALVAQPLT